MGASITEYSIEKDSFNRYRDEYSKGDLPISVVIPVYDEPEGIVDTLDSISESTYSDLEIVIGLTPADGHTHWSIRTHSYDNIQVCIEEKYQTPAAARNVAVEKATGEVLLFVDSAMTIESQFLWKLSYLFATENVDYLGCPVEMVDPTDLTLAGFYDTNFRFSMRWFMDVVGFCPTCCLGARRSIFESGLTFEPTLLAAEDVVFGQQVAEQGYAFGFCTDIFATHPVRNSLSDIIQKGMKTGRGFRHVRETCPEYDVHGRSRLTLIDSYLPRSREQLAARIKDWSEMNRQERTIIFLFAYLEILSITWGYAQDTIGI